MFVTLNAVLAVMFHSYCAIVSRFMPYLQSCLNSYCVLYSSYCCVFHARRRHGMFIAGSYGFFTNGEKPFAVIFADAFLSRLPRSTAVFD